MNRNLNEKISEIFSDVQFNKTCHQSNLKKLKKYYEQADSQVFWDAFVGNFRIPLSNDQKYPRIQNTLEFIAEFAVRLHTASDDDESAQEEPLCPFLVKMFDFLLTSHCAKNKAVRFRIWHFLNLLLNSMGDQAFIDDALCDKITISMMDRLLDKSPKVRVTSYPCIAQTPRSIGR
ncbi:condensin complex subunit 3-like [Halictus rubicundus]|uniref:condensin complex subunit 3-like n=1 Tax=Halictus rubicundus TaxID=77578 RepID=UPI004036801A